MKVKKPRHHYDIILSLDIGKISPDIGEFMDKLNSNFRAIAGESAGKLVLEGPVELGMVIDRRLTQEEENLVSNELKEKLKETQFRFERLKYIGIG